MNGHDHVVFSKGTDEWETPRDLFDALDAEFHFTLDACATTENHKCGRYYTPEDNGLSKDWSGECVWVNPPYSKIGAWVEKCYREGTKDNTIVVALIPSRTDTKYFHKFILHRCEIRFIRGRLKFNNAQNPAPFPSMIVIFRGAEV